MHLTRAHYAQPRIYMTAVGETGFLPKLMRTRARARPLMLLERRLLQRARVSLDKGDIDLAWVRPQLRRPEPRRACSGRTSHDRPDHRSAAVPLTLT